MNSFLKRSQVPSNAPAAAPKEVEPDPLFKAVDSAGYSHALIHSERLFGLENFGNTCYANSILQALYFCPPFREYVTTAYPNTPATPVLSVHNIKDGQLATSQPNPVDAQRKSSSASLTLPAPSLPAMSETLAVGAHDQLTSAFGNQKPSTINGSGPAPPAEAGSGLAPLEFKPSTMLTTLRDLFVAVALHHDRKGVLAPEAFITQLRRENESFRSTMHQDAHEFLNYLLNMIAEEADREIKVKQRQFAQQQQHNPAYVHKNKDKEQSQTTSSLSWVHSLFEGTLTNETLCLSCKNISSRDENFIDLSLDIEENSSVTSCLRQFSASEMMSNKNRFFCEKCGGLQDAERRMKIKHSPDVLALHLKRFKWQEDVQRFTKLSYRVVFPFELRLFNTMDESPDLDRLYHLWAIVVHIGGGPYHGHYITIVKSMGRWLLFDDENIQQIDESDISKYYGDTPGTGSGYVLFYQAADIVSPQPKTPPAHQPTFAQQFEATDGGEDAVESLEPDIVTPLAESSLEDRPNITKSHSTADSPTKEKKSFFGLSARKTSSRPRTAPEATTPSSQGGNSSEIASVSSSVDASDASSSSAMLVAPPQMHLDLSGPRVPLDANLTPPAPLSPPQSSDRRSSFGRFFSRSKSFRQHEPGPSTSPSKATAEPCITATSSQTQSSSSDMPSLSYEPSPPSAASPPKLDKKRIKERIKREKEEAKAKQKAEKDEAKRLKSELKRSKSIAIPSNQSDKS